jgi:hypothetical protein
MRPASRPLNSPEREEIAAQRIACSVLLHGCEVALSRYRQLQGRGEEAERARVEAILEDILFSWQETLELLEAVSPRRAQRSAREFLPLINAR